MLFTKGHVPWNKGKKLSKEHKNKISKSHKGIVSWNKGKKRWWASPSEFKKGHKMSKKVRAKISEKLKGIKRSEETKKKMGLARSKMRHSSETKKLISKNNARHWKNKTRPDISGENSSLWKGGKSFEPYGLEFNKDLKEQIRKRDNYTCKECGTTEKQLKYKLHCHHIDYNKKNNNTTNLISLCRKCHIKTNFKRKNWIEYFKRKLWQH